MNESISPNDIEIFNRLEFADVIWAYRPLLLNQKPEDVPQGHKIGPYIVLGHKNGNIVCLYATSTPPKTEEMRNYSLFVPKTDGNAFKKDTYIDVHRVITLLPKEFVRYAGPLTELERKQLTQKIEILKRKNVYSLRYINYKDLPLECGDIVWYENNLCLLIFERKNSFEGLVLKSEPDSKHQVSIRMNGVTYYCNIDDLVCVKKRPRPPRTDFIKKEQLNALTSKINDYYRNLVEEKRVKKGSIISLKDTLFYVFSEDEFYLQTFRAYTDNGPNYVSVKVGGNTYYIDPKESIRVSKNLAKNKSIHSSFEDELSIINNLKTEGIPIIGYAEYINRFKLGEIIKDNETGQNEYLVISSYLEIIIVIKKEEILTHDFHPIVVDANEYHKVSELDKALFKEILIEIKGKVTCNINSNEVYKLMKCPKTP